MTEKKLLDAIHRAFPEARLFRNDCGSAITGGRVVKMTGGILAVQDGRRISYGLLPGSGDLVGWATITVTPEMVGRKVAVFTSIEAKTENDRIREDQVVWARNVRSAGGIAKIIRSHGDQLLEEPIE